MTALANTTRGRRFAFLENAESDQLLSMLLSSLSELSVTRERLHAFECLAVKKGLITKEELEDYKFTQDEEAALDENQAALLEEVFYSLGFEHRQAKKRKSQDKEQASHADSNGSDEVKDVASGTRLKIDDTRVTENASA